MKSKPTVIISKNLRKVPSLLDLSRHLPMIPEPYDFEHLKGIAIDALPPPISENAQYSLVQKQVVRNNQIRFVASRKLSRQAGWYRQQMRLWGLQNLELLAKSRAWIKGRNFCRIKIALNFHRARILTKDGRPKRLDVHNHKKLLIDCLSELLGVDDCIFFEVTISKRPIPHGILVEWADVKIFEHDFDLG